RSPRRSYGLAWSRPFGRRIAHRLLPRRQRVEVRLLLWPPAAAEQLGLQGVETADTADQELACRGTSSTSSDWSSWFSPCCGSSVFADRRARADGRGFLTGSSRLR